MVAAIPGDALFAEAFAVWMETVVIVGAEADAVTCDCAKMQEAEAGRPEQARLTVPEKPLVGAMLRFVCAEAPAVAVRAPVAALNPKVGVPVAVELLEMPANSPWVSPASPAVK